MTTLVDTPADPTPGHHPASAPVAGRNHRGEFSDPTGLYLRMVYELTEQRIPVLRARLVERVAQAGPTVSQTVGRMERDGLVSLDEDRCLHLTEAGHVLAIGLIRKHRIAERFLTDVLGMTWADAHAEATGWERVIGDDAERRMLRLLSPPWTSPYGNPIPGLTLLAGHSPDVTSDAAPGPGRQSRGDRWLTLAAAAAPGAVLQVRWLSEWLQDDSDRLRTLAATALRPGQRVRVVAVEPDAIKVQAPPGDATPAAAVPPVATRLDRFISDQVVVYTIADLPTAAPARSGSSL